MKRPPTAWWYAIAAAVFALSLVPTLVVGVAFVNSIGGFEIGHVENGSTVTLGDEQKAIFVQQEPDGFASSPCSLTSPSGEAYPAPRPTATMTINGWERIGLSTESTPPGDYTLRCDVDVPTLGVVDNPDVSGIVVKTVLALGSPALGAVIALVIVIVTLVRRSSYRTRLRGANPNAP